MENEEILRQILSFQRPPHTFQFEKMLRMFVGDPSALYTEGINNVAQPGFVVAMQTRFMYDLEPQFGLNPPRYYYIDAAVLGPDILSDEAKYDGVRFYFGLEKTKGENKLTLIFTKVNAITYNKKNDVFTSSDVDYFVPDDPSDGNWRQIKIEDAEQLKDNLRKIVEEINNGVKEHYKNDGYFMGRDALRNVLSDSPSDDYNIDVDKKGIKLYFGLSSDKDNMPYNYEKDTPNDSHKELQLILVGVDDPTLAPLASFSNIYATLETDIIKYVEGVEIPIKGHDWPTAAGGNCILPSPRYSAS